MAIEHKNEDRNINRRMRLQGKGGIEYRLDSLERIVRTMLTDAQRKKLKDADKVLLERLEKADREHPEEND